MWILDDGDESVEESQEDAGDEGNETQAQPTLEELLAAHPILADEIEKLAQSGADKRHANFLAKQAREQRQREAAMSATQREAALEEALESGDVETAKALRQGSKQFVQVRTQLLGEIEDALKQHPRFIEELGEDTVNAKWVETLNEKGDMVDWLFRLTDERQTRQIKKLQEDIRKEIQEEYEAKLVEAGVETRSKDDEEGRSPAGALKGAAVPGGKRNIIDAAADGADIPFETIREELKKMGINPLKY